MAVRSVLTREERQACERAGRAALDAALARFSEGERAELWHSIRCGYVQPVTGAEASPSPTAKRARCAS